MSAHSGYTTLRSYDRLGTLPLSSSTKNSTSYNGTNNYNTSPAATFRTDGRRQASLRQPIINTMAQLKPQSQRDIAIAALKPNIHWSTTYGHDFNKPTKRWNVLIINPLYRRTPCILCLQQAYLIVNVCALLQDSCNPWNFYCFQPPVTSCVRVKYYFLFIVLSRYKYNHIKPTHFCSVDTELRHDFSAT